MNDLIAVKPFKADTSPAAAIDPRSRIAINNKAANLVISSEAVFDGPDGVTRGETLYFLAEVAGSPQAKKVLTVNEKEFILLNKVHVIAREFTK
jgi:hypothetical protein